MTLATQADQNRATPAARIAAAVVATIGITLLLVARNLEPDPRGYGTHEQLGLTSCYFQTLTGYECPMCGGTTAWAHLVRGQLAPAAAANLGGLLLGVAAVVSMPWLLWATLWGRWPIVKPTWKLLLAFASVWSAVVVVDWLRRIYLSL